MPELTKEHGAFIAPNECHELIGKDQISRRSLYNALNRREIPCVRLGKKLLIPKHAFQEWLQQRHISKAIKEAK